MLDSTRREFIALIGGGSLLLAVKVKRARGQQPAVPVVGFLNAASPRGPLPRSLSAFLKGLGETGHVDGQNVAIEYRWAEDQNDRLPAMVDDLVHRQVAVIASTGTPAALAAKAATAAIPIVFETSADPVQLGLVASLRRPGGNVTGVTQLNVEVAPKRLELLHELLPTVRVMALLANPANGALAEAQSRAVLLAARSLGLEVHVLNASTEGDLDGVFAKLIQLRAGGLVISGGPLFTGHSEKLAELAARHVVPAVSPWRGFAEAGGLLSYGSDFTDAYRLAGIYTGRILKGDKPADLPVQQATKVELYINLRTAKALGITVPLPLSGRADEVIE